MPVASLRRNLSTGCHSGDGLYAPQTVRLAIGCSVLRPELHKKLRMQPPKRATWLWESWTTRDWLLEMEAAGPRVTKDQPILDMDAFSDLIFLAQYLRLDGFKVFVERAKATDSEKDDAILQLRRHFPLVKFREVFVKNVQCSPGYDLDSIRSHLIEEGIFSAFDTGTADRYPYIHSLKSILEAATKAN